MVQDHVCIHAIVKGRVQGVWYRATTQQKARALGLKGWARNLANGDVEVIACGRHRQVEELSAWLWKGPALAKVTEVIVTETSGEDFADFEVR